MISFDPSEEEKSLQATVRKFAEEEIRPALREAETLGAAPRELLVQATELGLALLEYPERIGGLGLGMRSRVLVEEELSAGDVGVAQALGGPGPAGYALLEMGDPGQQAHWLAGFATDPGRHGALAVTEPKPGFRLSDTSTTALRDGEGYRLRGKKSFVDHGLAADPCVVLARLEDGSLALFAVAAGAAGRTAVKRHEKLGLLAVESVELTFADCLVPAGARLSAAEFAAGFVRMMGRLRLVTAARAVGLARAAFEYASRYSLERRAFGRTIAEHQGVAFLVAEMGIEVDAARNMVWQAAWAIDRRDATTARTAALALAQAGEAAMFVTNNAVQLLGGHGYMQDHPVEKWFRDAKTLVLSWGGLQALNLQICRAA